MAISTDRLFVPPEVEVDFFGFTAPAWRLQRSGWKFEELQFQGPTREDPFMRERCVVMRHETGLSAQAFCREEDLMYAVNSTLGLRTECHPVFYVRRAASRPQDLVFTGLIDAGGFRVRSLDMEPYPREALTRRIHRWCLADLFGRQAEEIIVEPKTVASLLEEIKQLQAPELAAIREKNRRRDPTRHLQDQPAPEWREEVSAQIITMRRAA